MKQIKSLRTRIAVWITGLILLALGTFGTFVYVNLSLSLHAAIDSSLSLTAAQTAASLNVDNGKIIISEPITPEESGFQAFSERGLTLIVLSKDGTILESVGPYRNTPQAFEQASPNGSFTTIPIVNDDDAMRVYTLPVLDNQQTVGWVQVMQSLGSARDTLDRLLLTLLLGGGLLAILSGFGGYFLATRVLSPIDSITRTADAISTEDLSARLPLLDTEDEVSRLASTFNNMLARLENGFKRERQFTADASHELRTPLAAMQAILSVVREGERPVSEYHQALDDLADETNRMRGLVEDLLSLARGEDGLALHSETLDLSAILSDVADSLHPLAQAKGLTLTTQLPSRLSITGDMDALIRLFVNLLDNSIKYTEKGGITVSAQVETEHVLVEISDTGVGIPKEHLSRIFERFYRVESARSSAGTGLGLAIARQIVLAHGGEISVISASGMGTTFIVTLPL